MRFTKPLLTVLVLALAVAAPVGAELCTIDVVPAKTLLLPYFEVDLKKLSNPRKAEVTTIHLSNVSINPSGPIVLEVTLWTDLAVPTVAWEIPLAEWGSFDVPVHEIFRGELPGKAPAAGADGLGADGPALRDAHSGRPVEPWNDECAAQDLGDRLARGYITIDVVGSGYVWGEASFLSQKSKYAQTVPLVHIEQQGNRQEPLGSTWGVRHSRESSDQSFVVVWRDTGGGERFTCGSPEEIDWYPLEQTQVVAFGADGSALEIPGNEVFLFPAATGLYGIGDGDLSHPFDSGWMFLNLNYGTGVKSSYVETLQYVGSGRRRGRNQAMMFTSACDN